MEYTISNKAKLTTIILVVVGIASLAVGLLTGHGEHTSTRLWANLLVNGYFFFSISLAAVFFIALQYVSEMAWGVTTQRIFQAIMSYMPIGAVVLLVVFVASSLHMNHLYHWMMPGVMEEGSEHYDPIIAGKSAYLNQPFFWGRTIAYILVWYYFARWFRKKSLEEDRLELNGQTSPVYTKAIVKGVIFIAFFAYTSSSSAWDWIMSIDTHWFSTMFGWYCFSGMWVSVMIVAVVLVQYLKRNGYLKEVNSSHVHDLGKWMFAISCLWSYIWFSQFMLIWYSDIPEEVTYYIQRFEDYKVLYLGTFFVNFFLPFFVLMSRDAKRNGIFLIPVALIIFLGHWMDVLIMVLPGTMFDHGHVGAVEIGMFLTFLGIFIFTVLRALSKAPLMTKNHPMYDESIHLHT
ncbi:MAG: quinol:cytochrome C oxidoreductase [Flavobacteriales bacterium]|nr:quinol:cytochrome C oxidoreductase [Flavobacteriales bacterium]